MLTLGMRPPIHPPHSLLTDAVFSSPFPAGISVLSPKSCSHLPPHLLPSMPSKAFLYTRSRNWMSLKLTTSCSIWLIFRRIGSPMTQAVLSQNEHPNRAAGTFPAVSLVSDGSKWLFSSSHKFKLWLVSHHHKILPLVAIYLLPQ